MSTTTTNIDPVTLAVVRGSLEQIADEMDATLFRSAFNPIIAEAHDACHGLYHAETGATLVQGAAGLPIFVSARGLAHEDQPRLGVADAEHDLRPPLRLLGLALAFLRGRSYASAEPRSAKVPGAAAIAWYLAAHQGDRPGSLRAGLADELRGQLVSWLAARDAQPAVAA
mgnify:CR=1 FL=1